VSRVLLVPLALLSCAQSGQSLSADESDARHAPTADVQAAADALDAGRPWRATTILAPVLADRRRRTPEAILLGARAAAGWSGWSDVDRLLRNEPWIDTAFAGHGRALLARAAFERRDDSGAVRDARAAIAAALDASERGARLVLLARALERLDQRDSARVTYEQAAAALPAAADWLRLRAAGLTTDTAARVAAYAGLTIPATRARAPWVEAQVRERTGDLTGAAARYEALGANMTAVRIRLAATADPTARQAIRSQLFAIIERRPGSSDARAAVDIVTQAFSLTPSEELAVARSAGKSGPTSRAAASFARAFAGAVGTAEDRYSYGMVLMQLGRNADAAQQLNLVRSGPLVADATYQRARALLRTSRVDLAAAILERVVRSHASSVEAASAALFLLGDLATDRRQDEHARALFRRVAHAYPTSSVAPAARFRAALIAFVMGDHRTAALELDTLATKYEQSAEAQAASYWSGRAWASVGDTIAAQTRWRAVRHREPLSYYALLSARRLGAEFSTLPEPADTLAVPPEVTKALERARLLEQLGLEWEARYEYDRLAADADVSTARMLAAAAGFRAHELAPRAMQLARRAIARGAPADARTYRLLYPIAYEDLVRAEAQARQVDPALVAALIRQESNFEPRAVSRVGAAGLMQIMPELGRRLATSHGFTSWKDPLLRQPEVNVQLGTAHLASLLRQYSDVSHALAAYNAGSGRAARWLMKRGTEDPEVFVERIPFTETRDYVRIVQRNRAIYGALYGASPGVADER
jgi:soluble lytic murein transglycosylase